MEVRGSCGISLFAIEDFERHNFLEEVLWIHLFHSNPRVPSQILGLSPASWQSSIKSLPNLVSFQKMGVPLALLPIYRTRRWRSRNYINCKSAPHGVSKIREKSGHDEIHNLHLITDQVTPWCKCHLYRDFPRHAVTPRPFPTCRDDTISCLFSIGFSPLGHQPSETWSLLHCLRGQVTEPRSAPALQVLR